MERFEGIIVSQKAAASQVIAGGYGLVTNASGLLEIPTDAAAKIFAGVAATDHSSTTASELVDLYKTGVFPFAGTGFDQADVGKEVLITAAGTVALTGTTTAKAGRIVTVESSTKVWVRIDSYA